MRKIMISCQTCGRFAIGVVTAADKCAHCAARTCLPLKLETVIAFLVAVKWLHCIFGGGSVIFFNRLYFQYWNYSIPNISVSVWYWYKSLTMRFRFNCAFRLLRGKGWHNTSRTLVVNFFLLFNFWFNWGAA